MKLLDLFCCAGGAARGYVRAGFDVVGVDVEPRPNYPYAFLQADATRLDVRFIRHFDFVHASPPCQFATALRHAPGTRRDHVNLIPPTRDLLLRAGVPFVIENVWEAREHLRDPVLLCGTMFSLGVEGFDLQRHRLFEAHGFDLAPPRPCDHRRPVVGVYGGHARNRSAKHGGRRTADVWVGGHKAAVPAAMGLPPGSATLAEMSEAIPPDYAEWIGLCMMRSARRRAA